MMTKAPDIFTVPPYALSEYLNLEALTILKRSHRFFNKLSHISSPIIHLSSRKPLTSYYPIMLHQYPKCKLVHHGDYNSRHRTLHPILFPNIISLDLNTCNTIEQNISTLTKLTSLSLEQCQAITTELVNLTRLESLSLTDNHRIVGSSLQKLKLRELKLNNNGTVTDDHIISFPLISLSLLNNRTITPSILSKFNLTELNILRYKPALLANEIIKCTTLINLELNMDTLLHIGFKTLAHMTHLKKLTIDSPTSIFADSPAYLQNLSCLHLNHIEENIKIPPLTSLQTLIIQYYSKSIDLSSASLHNLHHLEIHKLSERNFSLKNLTYLHAVHDYQLYNKELREFQNLTKLIIDTRYYDRTIDITHLKSLISLAIIGGKLQSFVCISEDSKPVANRTLQSLTINSYEAVPNVDDISLTAFPNLKYFCLDRTKIRTSCFENLQNLFWLAIATDNNLDAACIPSLIKRGIIIKYWHIWPIIPPY